MLGQYLLHGGAGQLREASDSFGNAQTSELVVLLCGKANTNYLRSAVQSRHKVERSLFGWGVSGTSYRPKSHMPSVGEAFTHFRRAKPGARSPGAPGGFGKKPRKPKSGGATW